MGNLPGASFGLCLNRAVTIVVMTLLLMPSFVQAETLNLFCVVENERPRSEGSLFPQKADAQRMFLEVADNGDFVMRHRNVSVVLAYNTPTEDQRLPDYAHELQPRECAAVNGMSVKIGFTF